MAVVMSSSIWLAGAPGIVVAGWLVTSGTRCFIPFRSRSSFFRASAADAGWGRAAWVRDETGGHETGQSRSRTPRGHGPM